jgi:hypothetical protein
VPKPDSRLLLPILLIALILRVGWAIVQPTSAAAIDRLPDQREYLSLAQNLLQHGRLCFVDPRFNQTVWAYRMPGYPLFLCACGGSIQIARMAECLVDVSTLLAVFLIARQLSGSAMAGMFAAGLMAANPFYIYFSSLILSETLFAASIAWGLWFLVRRRWLLAMVFGLASCYIRPTGLLFVPLLALVGNVNSPGRPAYRLWSGLSRCAVATLIILVCLFPWAWRNHRILGSWIWTTTNAGVTLYDGFNPGATGASDQRFVTNPSRLRPINEADRSRFFADAASAWIRHNWRAIPGLSAKKILRGWSPVPLSQDFGRPGYRWISAAYSIPFDLLCLLGLFSARLSPRAKMLLVMPALVVTLAQVISVGSIRYRMPAEAPVAVLAGTGIVGLARRKFEERNLE